MSSTSERRSFNVSKVAEELVPEKLNRNLYLSSVGISLVILVILLLVYNYLPRVIPLLLTESWGEGRLVPRLWVLGLPGMIWIIIAINLVLGKSWRGTNEIVPKILGVASLVFSIAMLFGVWGILQAFVL